jgi:5-oxopent-3-ene-1,2,5-tricarboxylate decarboxylase / 2-hydroxyhepta-2,4-diene-1,7-dioate isomerase
MNPHPFLFDIAPYRLSGTVYGVLLNHRESVAALGAAAQAAPYKGLPVAPVLYIKPHNTLATSGSTVHIPADASELEVGATLGVVIGRAASHVREGTAMEHVAGYMVVNDVSVPHDEFYRPSLRFKVRDGFCPMGSTVLPRSAVANPNALAVRVSVNGALVHETSTGNRVRSIARLLADVSEFMTLHPGDVLMIGVAHGAPRVRAGQQVTIEIDGVGRLVNRFEAQKETAE